jgi:hypothetical protein
VKAVRGGQESVARLFHLVQRGHVVAVQRDAGRGEVLLEVRHRRRSRDHLDPLVALEQPRQRDLGRRRAVLRGDARHDRVRRQCRRAGGDARIMGRPL